MEWSTGIALVALALSCLTFARQWLESQKAHLTAEWIVTHIPTSRGTRLSEDQRLVVTNHGPALAIGIGAWSLDYEMKRTPRNVFDAGQFPLSGLAAMQTFHGLMLLGSGNQLGGVLLTWTDGRLGRQTLRIPLHRSYLATPTVIVNTADPR